VEVRNTLQFHKILNESSHKPKHLFYVSDFPQKFEEIARRLLGRPLVNVHHIVLEDGV
jgi:glutamate racemase